MKRAETDTDATSAQHIGPAHAELHSIATDAQRATPGLSYQRAVANILESKPGMRARVKEEYMRHSLANAGSQQGNNTMGKINFAKQAPSNDAVELKKLYDAGKFDEMTKADWGTLINNEAENARRPGESFEKAYARLITEDPAGREAFRAYQSCESRAMYKQVFGKAASGDAVQDYVPPAEAEMRSMAARHHAANPHKSYEQSYVSEFTDPKNRSLAERIKAEGILAAHARMHG